MAQWSADPDAGSPPIPDAERRVDLQKRLVVAEAQARAATGAMSGPRAAMNAAGIRASAAQRQAVDRCQARCNRGSGIDVGSAEGRDRANL